MKTKTRLTIMVDSELLPRARQYAHARGVSLSSLVEAALREVAEAETPSFASRWRGRFKPADRDDTRYRALAGKCL